MADYCIEKKTAGAPGKDWVLAFGTQSRSFPVALSESKAIELFNRESSRSTLPLRLVTWDGIGRLARKRVVCLA
jgi:hypothetical protein